MESSVSAGHSTSSLGEELKRRREARGMTLRQISDDTRINMRFLQAIESDNYRVLPGAMFNRRFVAAVAKYIGMDEEEAVRWYIEQEQAHPDNDSSGYIPPDLNAVAVVEEPQSSRAWIVGIVILALAGLIYGGWRSWPTIRTEFGGSTAKNESDSKPAPPTKPAETPAQTVSQNTSQPNQQTQQPPPQDQQAQSTAVGPNQLNVQIKVIKDQCWIRAKVDNEQFHDLTLKTGEEKSFDPKDKLELSIGESKNVEVRINGKLAHFDKSVISRAVITPANAAQYTPDQQQ